MPKLGKCRKAARCLSCRTRANSVTCRWHPSCPCVTGMSVRDAETKNLNTPPVASARLGVPLALTAIERRANHLAPVRWTGGETGSVGAAVLAHLRADETFTDLKKRLY